MRLYSVGEWCPHVDIVYRTPAITATACRLHMRRGCEKERSVRGRNAHRRTAPNLQNKSSRGTNEAHRRPKERKISPWCMWVSAAMSESAAGAHHTQCHNERPRPRADLRVQCIQRQNEGHGDDSDPPARCVQSVQIVRLCVSGGSVQSIACATHLCRTDRFRALVCISPPAQRQRCSCR